MSFRGELRLESRDNCFHLISQPGFKLVTELASAIIGESPRSEAINHLALIFPPGRKRDCDRKGNHTSSTICDPPCRQRAKDEGRRFTQALREAPRGTSIEIENGRRQSTFCDKEPPESWTQPRQDESVLWGRLVQAYAKMESENQSCWRADTPKSRIL